MKRLRSHYREVVIAVLFLTNIFVWVAVSKKQPGNKLNVYFFDVGQGDSVFIDSPSHGRVLVDGGPTRAVLGELGKVLPFGDKRIDAVIETHPDQDHIGGLPEVVSRFKVGAFIEPGVKSTNSTETELQNRIAAQGVPELLTRRGLVVDFGDGAKLEILFPNQEVSSWETNDASVVAKLVYGNESFLLTGDSSKKAEFILLGLNENLLKSNVLKVAHHGSKTSTSLAYAQAVAPEYAVISAGKDNTYGHPNKETLDLLKGVGSQIVSTESAGGLSALGTIHFQTNGETLKLK